MRSVRMLELAHQDHGKMRWAELFPPAIKLASDGFPISGRMAAAISGARTDLMRDAAAVTCVTSPRMQSLFETSFPGLDSRGEVEGLRASDFDTVLAIASLGPVYRGAAADFPGRPYLRARDAIVAGWRTRLGEKTTRLRVGVSWRGGADITRAVIWASSLSNPVAPPRAASSRVEGAA